MSDEDGGWTKSHEFATQYAIEGIRALVIANGGAVVAILTFCGNAQNTRIDIPAVAGSLAWFAGGLVLALVTSLFAYLAQGSHTHEWKRADAYEWVSTGAAVLAVGLFGMGAVTALHGFQAPKPRPQVAAVMPLGRSCEAVVEFIRAQADPGRSSATNDKLGSEAVLIRGGWVILPSCK